MDEIDPLELMAYAAPVKEITWPQFDTAYRSKPKRSRVGAHKKPHDWRASKRCKAKARRQAIKRQRWK